MLADDEAMAYRAQTVDELIDAMIDNGVLDGTDEILVIEVREQLLEGLEVHIDV